MTYGMPEHDRSPAQAHTPAAPSAASGGYTPQAGWYPDPQDAARVRFWDGRDWTLDSFPAPVAQAAPDSPYSSGPSTFGGYVEPAGPSGGSIAGGYVPGYVPGAASGLPPQPPRDAAHGPRSVGPISALTTAFTRVLDYGGRSSRSEYWWVTLILGAIQLVLLVKGSSATTSSRVSTSNDVAALALLPFFLVTFVFTLPLLIRRLHDTGRAGWWVFLGMIPIGSLVVLLFTADASQPGRNQYGPGPT